MLRGRLRPLISFSVIIIEKEEDRDIIKGIALINRLPDFPRRRGLSVCSDDDVITLFVFQDQYYQSAPNKALLAAYNVGFRKSVVQFPDDSASYLSKAVTQLLTPCSENVNVKHTKSTPP